MSWLEKKQVDNQDNQAYSVRNLSQMFQSMKLNKSLRGPALLRKTTISCSLKYHTPGSHTGNKIAFSGQDVLRDEGHNVEF